MGCSVCVCVCGCVCDRLNLSIVEMNRNVNVLFSALCLAFLLLLLVVPFSSCRECIRSFCGWWQIPHNLQSDCRETDLSYNNITILPGMGFNGLIQITELNLEYNQIWKIENNAFLNLNNMEKLLLNNNEILEIQTGAFRGLNGKLRMVILRKNSIRQITTWTINQNFKRVTDLDLGQNQIETIDDFAFQYMEGLKRLSLDSNDLATINANTFAGLKSLIDLHLGWNHITSISLGAFDHLVSLKTLRLHGNGLTSLNFELFEQLPRLPLVLALSDPRRDGDRPWFCSTLFWLKKEEQQGKVVWLTVPEGDFSPECWNQQQWSSLPFPDKYRTGNSRFFRICKIQIPGYRPLHTKRQRQLMAMFPSILGIMQHQC